MKCLYLIFAFIATFWTSVASAGELNITITEPIDGSKVAVRNYVKGTVSNSNSEVWVVIHPAEISEFWIQRP